MGPTQQLLMLAFWTMSVSSCIRLKATRNRSAGRLVHARAVAATRHLAPSHEDIREHIDSKMIQGSGAPTHLLAKLRIPSAWNLQLQEKDAKNNPCVVVQKKLDSQSEDIWPGGMEERNEFWENILPFYDVVNIQVFSMLIGRTVRFGHWGLMVTLKDPVKLKDPADKRITLYAAVHRVQRAWECISGSYCNHVEVAVFDDEAACRYALTAAILPRRLRYTVSESEILLGKSLRAKNKMQPPKFREVIRLSESFMQTQAAFGFSLLTDNCRDFIRWMLLQLVWVSPETVRDKLSGGDTALTEVRQILRQFGWTGFKMQAQQAPEGSKDYLRTGEFGKTQAEPCAYHLPSGQSCMDGSVRADHCRAVGGECEPICEHPINQNQKFCTNFGLSTCGWKQSEVECYDAEEFYDTDSDEGKDTVDAAPKIQRYLTASSLSGNATDNQ